MCVCVCVHVCVCWVLAFVTFYTNGWERVLSAKCECVRACACVRAHVCV